MAVTCIVWVLFENDIANLTFKGGMGYQYLTVLASFFVVSNVNTTYSRYWEARGYLGKLMTAATSIASRGALYSANEKHESAVRWRTIVRMYRVSCAGLLMFRNSI